MSELLRSNRFNLVIPIDDGCVRAVQRHRDELGELARLYTLTPRSFELAFDKVACCALAAELGIPQPKQKVVTPGDTVADVLAELALPVVVKPPSSSTLENVKARRKVVRARTEADLNTCLSSLANWGTALVQESFPGRGVGVELLACEGEVLTALQHVRIRELPQGGSSYRCTVPLHPGLLDAAREMIRAMAYTGVAMVEFRYDFSTGRWVFIEVNGRFWGSLPLALAAGMDFPLYLYELLLEGRRDFPTTYDKGVFSRNTKLELVRLAKRLRAGRADPSPATTKFQAMPSVIRSILRFRQHNDCLVADDWRPGVEEIVSILRELAGLAAGPLKDTIAGIPLVRRLLARQAARRVRTARRILFVCKGNICRSPFAEQFALGLLGDQVRVCSSGYYPRSGRACPDTAVEAAKAFDVDLSGHRSRMLTRRQLEETDAIVVFDRQNVDVLVGRYPSLKRKFVYLGLFLSDAPVTIRDPYGSGLEAFKSTYARIAEGLEGLKRAVSRSERG